MTDKSPLMNIKKRKTEIRKRIEREKKGETDEQHTEYIGSLALFDAQGRTEPNQMKWKYSAKGCHRMKFQVRPMWSETEPRETSLLPLQGTD